MSRNGTRLAKSLAEALAHIEGKAAGVRVTEIDEPTIDVKAIRKKLSLTQPKMATLLGTSVSGLRKWEQGQRRPRGAVLTLLRVAEKEPEAVLRAIGR